MSRRDQYDFGRGNKPRSYNQRKDKEFQRREDLQHHGHMSRKDQHIRDRRQRSPEMRRGRGDGMEHSNPARNPDFRGNDWTNESRNREDFTFPNNSNDHDERHQHFSDDDMVGGYCNDLKKQNESYSCRPERNGRYSLLAQERTTRSSYNEINEPYAPRKDAMSYDEYRSPGRRSSCFDSPRLRMSPDRDIDYRSHVRPNMKHDNSPRGPRSASGYDSPSNERGESQRDDPYGRDEADWTDTSPGRNGCCNTHSYDRNFDHFPDRLAKSDFSPRSFDEMSTAKDTDFGRSRPSPDGRGASSPDRKKSSHDRKRSKKSKHHRRSKKAKPYDRKYHSNRNSEIEGSRRGNNSVDNSGQNLNYEGNIPNNNEAYQDVSVQKLPRNVLYVFEKLILEGGSMKYEKLQKKYHHRWSDVQKFPKDLESIIELYGEDALKYNEQDLMISLENRLNICTNYGTCPGDCSKLHVCQFFMEGRICKYQGGCKYGHNLEDSHNVRILHDRKLLGLSHDNLKLLYGLSVPQKFPEVCSFYNNMKRACKHQANNNGMACPALHVCLHYVKGDCKYGHRCQRSHDILAAQPKNRLLMSGVDFTVGTHQLLARLRKSIPESKMAKGVHERSPLMNRDKKNINFHF